MALKNNYDKIAFRYDKLSQFVFGDHIKQSQISLLSFISPGDNILIVGGGTGWILEEITKLHAGGLHIVYVEASAKMLALAKAKNVAGNNVAFVHQYIEQYQSSSTFDIVITNFLFDNFDEETATKNFNHLNTLLNKKGKWLFSDFSINNKTKVRYKLLLKIMYLFFKVASNIEANRLVNMNPLFLEKGYKEIFCKYYFNKFIKASCWEK